MNNIYLMIFLVLIMSCSGCGNGSSPSSYPTGSALSTGLKIFVTVEEHVGDFLNDPTLNGSTGIEKADDFCNKSESKPNGSIYKALLVDGINRDAISLTDWVLEASTTYYRPYDNIKIGTTSDTGILNASWSDLDNSIAECDQSCVYGIDNYVWTGIDNAGDFSTMGNTCDSWSTSNSSLSGHLGFFPSKDGSSVSSNEFRPCNQLAYIYCVEQL